MEEKCERCLLNDKNKKQLLDYIKELQEKAESKPSALAIIAFGMSCFTLGISITKLLLK